MTSLGLPNPLCGPTISLEPSLVDMAPLRQLFPKLERLQFSMPPLDWTPEDRQKYALAMTKAIPSLQRITLGTSTYLCQPSTGRSARSEELLRGDQIQPGETYPQHSTFVEPIEIGWLESFWWKEYI